MLLCPVSGYRSVGAGVFLSQSLSLPVIPPVLESELDCRTENKPDPTLCKWSTSNDLVGPRGKIESGFIFSVVKPFQIFFPWRRASEFFLLISSGTPRSLMVVPLGHTKRHWFATILSTHGHILKICYCPDLARADLIKPPVSDHVKLFLAAYYIPPATLVRS